MSPSWRASCIIMGSWRGGRNMARPPSNKAKKAFTCGQIGWILTGRDSRGRQLANHKLNSVRCRIYTKQMFSDWFTKKAYSYCIIYIKEQLSGRKNFWRIHTFNCTYMCIEAIACGKLPRIIIVQQPVHGMDEWLLACRLSFPNFGTIHLWVFTQNCNFQHYKICLTHRQIETERDRGEGSQVSPAFLGQIIHYQTACRTPSSALLCSALMIG